jgi:serine/threonine-protein kinase
MKPEILKGNNSDYLFFPQNEETILSAGKFSIVYLGADAANSGRVIIKELNPRIKDDQKARLRFLAEASVQIRHPAVIRTLDLVKANKTYYIIQEYVRGTDLKKLIDSGAFQKNEELICRFILPLLDALEAVHSQGFIHRDIKPSNILIGYKAGSDKIDWKTPDVRLIDFGLTKTNDGIPLFPGAKKRAPFSLLYSAPEVVLGMESLTDQRADLYSLALVMMEMFTRQPVVYADTPPQIISKQLSRQARRPSGMHPKFYNIFTRATAKEPFNTSPAKMPVDEIKDILEKGKSARYPSASEMKEALIDFLDDPGEMPKGLFQRIFKG